MKKNTPKIVIVLLVALAVFSSCTQPEEIENVLIGSWKYTNYQTGDWEKLVFREDLTYTLTHYDAESASSTVYSGDYSFNEYKFVLEQRYYYDIAFYYSVTDDRLIIADGKTYIRQ